MSKKVIVGVIALFTLLLGIIFTLVNNSEKSSEPSGEQTVEITPTEDSTIGEVSESKSIEADGVEITTTDNSVIVKPAGVQVESTYSIVEDFACGYCRQLHGDSKPIVAEILEAEKPVAFEYIFVAFLGQEQSWSEFTAMYVDYLASVDPSKVLTVVDYFYSHDQNFGNLEEELAKVNEVSGVEVTIDELYMDTQWRDKVAERSMNLYEQGVTGTPTIFKNGELLGDLNAYMVELKNINN